MKNCPPEGSFSVCERVSVGTSGYTYVRGNVETRPVLESTPKERFSVETLGKDMGSILLNFEVKLRSLELKGVPYATLNRYFKTAMSDDQYGMFDLKALLTYERTDPVKTYADAYLALSQIPGTISMTWLYSVVDGIPK